MSLENKIIEIEQILEKLLEQYTSEQQEIILEALADQYGTKTKQQALKALVFVTQYPTLTRTYTPTTQEQIKETAEFIKALKPKQAKQNITTFQQQLNKIPQANYERDTTRYCNRLQQTLKNNADRLERITE